MGSACATAACSTYADLTNPKSALNPAGTWKYESEPKAINGLNIVGGYYRDKDITGASNYHAALWNISLSGNNSITLPTPSGANPNKPSAVLGVSNRSDGMQFAVGYVSKTDGTQVAAEWAASSTNLSAAIGTIAQPNGSLNSVLQSVNSSGQSVGRLRRPYSLKVIYPGGGSSGDEDLAFMYDFNRSTIDGYQPGDEYQLVRNLAAPNDGILMAVRAVAINDATEIIIYGYGMDGEDGYWKLIPPPSFTEVGLLAPKNFACDPIPEYPAQPDPPTSWPPLPPATESPDSALGGLDIVGLGLLAAAYKIRRRRKA